MPIEISPKNHEFIKDFSLICCIFVFVQVYKLHRETLYLAVDFLDRYLGATREMPRNRLQLVGITCLFVASKIEEIYPPKLREFAFVTDGACSEEEITHMELVVLKGLNWGLSPQTPNRWIKTYMQVNNLCTNLPSFNEYQTQLVHVLALSVFKSLSLHYGFQSLLFKN